EELREHRLRRVVATLHLRASVDDQVDALARRALFEHDVAGAEILQAVRSRADRDAEAREHAFGEARAPQKPLLVADGAQLTQHLALVIERLEQRRLRDREERARVERAHARIPPS